MKAKIICLDNGGETWDRYTIIDTKTGDMVGASELPFSPLGFGQFVGNVADNYWNVAFGYGWRRGCSEETLKMRVKYAIANFLADCAHVGRRVDFDALPDDVKRFAVQSFELAEIY